MTIEKIRAVLAEKAKTGKLIQVKALLAKHGATKLTDVDPKSFAEMLSEAEEL